MRGPTWKSTIAGSIPALTTIYYKTGVPGFDRLQLINTISQRDNCKLRWIDLNGKNKSRVVSLGDNAQVEANMNKVFSLLNVDTDLGVAA